MLQSLALNPILRRLPAEAQAALAEIARSKVFERREPIMGPGAPPAVHLLVKGLAKRWIETPASRRHAAWLVGPGELLGTSAVFSRSQHDVQVVALERTETLAFAAGDLLRLGRSHPGILLALAEHYARRIQHMADQALGATTEDVAARLARLILEIAPPCAADEFVLLRSRLTHRTLAEAVGATRPYTTVVLGELERQGALRREGRRLYIRPQTLRSIALSGVDS